MPRRRPIASRHYLSAGREPTRPQRDCPPAATYTQAEIEEFINGHTGDGNPATKRPTAAEVHDALTNGTPEPMGDGRTAEQAEQFVYKGIKVVVNYEMPWKSTAWKLP
ncbi:hypothetical protein [Nocardia sp. NPDC005998]|uniref:hypothetical protein n=1 Tax=Nocardia sp. NPDC005998 TaxID=3156894 RepID=UPI0033BCD3DB